MENRRYDYSPIIRRPKIEWPEHGRIALWVAPNIEYFHYDMPIRGSGSNHTPDVPGYTLRDYGSRVGVYRIMEVLDKHGIRASVLLNAEVCDKHPPIIEEGNKRKWEWLGHGMTNSISMLDYPPQEERAIIHNVKEIITKATGRAPTVPRTIRASSSCCRGNRSHRQPAATPSAPSRRWPRPRPRG